MAKNKTKETDKQNDINDDVSVRFYKKYEKQIRFVLTGGLNTVIDFALFNTLKSVFGIGAEISNIISTSICIAISFYLNSKFVWKTNKSITETAPGFLIVSLFSAWIVQTCAIRVIINIWGDTVLVSLIAKLFASACGMISNYFGYKVVFSVDFKKFINKLKK